MSAPVCESLRKVTHLAHDLMLSVFDDASGSDVGATRKSTALLAELNHQNAQLYLCSHFPEKNNFYIASYNHIYILTHLFKSFTNNVLY